MTVYTEGTWAGGCIHHIVQTRNPPIKAEDRAKKLFAMSFEDFCDELQLLIDIDFMTEEKADATYNAYAKKQETLNAYEGGDDDGV